MTAKQWTARPCAVLGIGAPGIRLEKRVGASCDDVLMFPCQHWFIRARRERGSPEKRPTFERPLGALVDGERFFSRAHERQESRLQRS
ncbi:unnamed protein product [Lota lota]